MHQPNYAALAHTVRDVTLTLDAVEKVLG